MFTTLSQSFKDIETAVLAGDYKGAWAKEIALQQAAFDLLFGHGEAGCPACPEEHKAELQAACAAAVAACHTTRAGVGAIGDGTILALLLQALPQILALFIKPAA